MNEREKGFIRILSAVEAQKPQIHPNDAKKVARTVIRKLNKIIVQGDVLAFIKKDKEGVIDELITYALKERLK